MACSPYSPRAARAGSSVIGSPSRAWTNTPGFLTSPPAPSPPTSSGSVAAPEQAAANTRAVASRAIHLIDDLRLAEPPPLPADLAMIHPIPGLLPYRSDEVTAPLRPLRRSAPNTSNRRDVAPILWGRDDLCKRLLWSWPAP